MRPADKMLSRLIEETEERLCSAEWQVRLSQDKLSAEEWSREAHNARELLAVLSGRRIGC